MLAASLLHVATLGGLPAQATDWLINPPTDRTVLRATDDDGGLLLTNGLISRAFLARGGAFCTVDLRQEPSARSYFRALAPEANLTLLVDGADGSSFDVGGCAGMPSGHFEFFDADALLPNLTANASAFQYANHSTSPPTKLFEWTPGVRGAPTDIAWPPKGLHLAVRFVPPDAVDAALRHVVVTVHYEMYDGLPTYRKWVSVENAIGRDDGRGVPHMSRAVVVDSLHYELLRAPNWAPEHMSVARQQANNPTPFDPQLKPDIPHLATLGRTLADWYIDPEYDQCCDKELHVPYSAYTLLAVGYGWGQIYGGPTGPGARLEPGDSFESLSVRVTLHDSTDIERQGLAIRQMLRTLAPALNEAPLLGMLTDVRALSDTWHARTGARTHGRLHTHAYYAQVCALSLSLSLSLCACRHRAPQHYASSSTKCPRPATSSQSSASAQRAGAACATRS